MNSVHGLVGKVLSYKFRRTTLISVACLSFLAGILSAQWSGISWTWLIPALAFVLVLKKKNLAALLILVLLGIVVGQLRGMYAIASQEPITDLYGRQVTVRAVVVEDGYYDDKRRLTFIARTEEIISPKRAVVSAPLRVSTYTLTGATRGDILILKGKLTSSVGNVAGAMYYADAELIGRQATWLNGVRRKFEAGLQNALPEPQASFAAGLLIGQRSGLPEVWQNILRDAGLTHIIAVSGYNLTILVAFSRRLLKKGSRYQILMVSTMLVGSFVIITGLSPSILRAVIVTSLLQLGWFYGRRFHPITLISIAIAISAWIDPFQVWRSIGWYLSFAAFFGIIVLAPLLTRSGKPTISTDPSATSKAFSGLISESLSAQIMTLPIIAAIFGQISFVGLIANIIVAPLIPLAMLFSFIAGLAGWFVPVISGWLAIPANIILTFILDIANVVSRLPGARISLDWSGITTLIIYTVMLAVICSLWWLRRRRLTSDVLESKEE